MEDRLDRIIRFYFEDYLARLNIEYYKKLLETEIDEPKRRIVTRLLAEEHANVVQAISKAIVREAEKDPDQKSVVNG
jgi:ATP sulfurylase